MSPITTHVLDTSLGRPAEGVTVTLEFRGANGIFQQVGFGTTDADGRLRTLLSPEAFHAGSYRITFDVRSYHAAQEIDGFYPEIPIVFYVRSVDQHYHVPLLLSPWGYSTYRGS